jgi:peptidoglycan hydrolase CwlO-like protein
METYKKIIINIEGKGLKELVTAVDCVAANLERGALKNNSEAPDKSGRYNFCVIENEERYSYEDLGGINKIKELENKLKELENKIISWEKENEKDDNMIEVLNKKLKELMDDMSILKEDYKINEESLKRNEEYIKQNEEIIKREGFPTSVPVNDKTTPNIKRMRVY